MKKVKKKITSIITSLLMTGLCSVSKAFDNDSYEEYQEDYLYTGDDGEWDDDYEENDSYQKFLLALKIFSVAAAARLGMNLIYRLSRILLAIKDVHSLGLNTENYWKTVIQLSNKAYKNPELREKVNAFLESFNERTELNEQNITVAVMAVSWYATGMKTNIDNNLKVKLTTVIRKIATYLTLEGDLEVLSAGNNGVVAKIGASYYKIGRVQNEIGNYVKDENDTEINKALSDKNNKYVKIYKSNKLTQNHNDVKTAGVLELDYCKPAKMNETNDLFVCIHDLCKGILYLHNKDLVHKDIKLANTIITLETDRIRLKLIDPDDIGFDGSDMLGVDPTRYRAVDFLPFKKATKSLDVHMVGNTIEELMEKYKNTEGVDPLSAEDSKRIKNYIDKCHAFFNGKALSYIVSDIQSKYNILD